MAQDWASPTLAAAPPTVPSPHLLRPLTTGEVLDNTFALYRSRFWLFAGLASLGGAWQVVLQGMQLLAQHLIRVKEGLQAARIEAQLSSVILMLLMLPVTAVVYAAAVYAMGEVYLGRTVTVSQALKTTRAHWLRYMGISLWWGWSAVWVGLLVVVPGLVLMLVIKGVAMIAVGGLLLFFGMMGGGVYGAIAYIRNSLAVAASVVETLGVRASMRRSKQLAAGTKGRIFVVLLIAAVLYVVVATAESPLLLLIVRNPNAEHIVAQGIILLVGFLAHTLIAPVSIIGLTLVYFDQRVRKEAFDLVMLLGAADPAPGLAFGAEVGFVPEPTETAPVAMVAETEPVAASEIPAELPALIEDDGHV
jgi:hypothetical protein